MDIRVVESYWLGGGVGAGLDPLKFGTELLAVIGPQAGSYWSHLTPDLLSEAAGNHCFHVLGVYPWSRLLGKGADGPPMHVLDSCRISWGTVLSRDGTTVDVWRSQLDLRDGMLALANPAVVRVDFATEGYSAVPDVAVGDQVALHWGQVCGRLDPSQARELIDSTRRQLAHTNRRLAQEQTP